MIRAAKLGYLCVGNTLAEERIETPYRLASSGWTRTALILASSVGVSTPFIGTGVGSVSLETVIVEDMFFLIV
jgi:hypothetical protein